MHNIIIILLHKSFNMLSITVNNTATDPTDSLSTFTAPPATDPSDSTSTFTAPPATDPSDSTSANTAPPATGPPSMATVAPDPRNGGGFRATMRLRRNKREVL